MFAAIRELNQQFIDAWREGNDNLPDLGRRYTAQAQTQNEKGLLQLSREVERMLTNPPRSREESQAARLQLGAAVRRLAEEALDLPAAQLDLLPTQAFSGVAEEFVRAARAFDPGLGMDDIYQAGRNAWTAHGLQWLLDRPVQLTPSILAYSLLYPYTDNYLDDPQIAAAAKRVINERFGRRLAGDLLIPTGAQEKTIFDLVGMIEKQYPRGSHPAVYESLLAIHHAQSRSVDLLRRSGEPGDVDVPGLIFYKGGTSVLADGYLVSGSLTRAQQQYTYGHGILAQLLDDMEDIEEDCRAGRLTMYAQLAGHGPVDGLASRTFHFSHRILVGLDCFEVDDSVRELIRRGADLVLIDAISRTGRFYTSSYLQELEAYSPFRFSFLLEQRNEFARRHGPLGKWMEKVMLYGRF